MALDMYQEVILQHYRSPRNFGALDHPDLSGEESNPLCGDHIRIDLKLNGASHDTIERIGFSGDGCAISVASTSLLTQKLQGLSVDKAKAIQKDDVLKLVGIPLSPVRVKCALTGFVALGKALHGGSMDETDAAPEAGS